MPQQSPEADPKKILLVTRVVWAAMALSIIIFTVVIAFMAAHLPPQKNNPVGPMIYYIAWGAMIVLVPVGLFIRGQIFKRGWQGDAVKPQAYLSGNIIAFATCEGPAMIGIVSVLAERKVMPSLLPVIASLLMLLIIFPNGRAMFAPTE